VGDAAIQKGDAGGKVTPVGEAWEALGKATPTVEALGKAVPADGAGERATPAGELGGKIIPEGESGDAAIEAKLIEARAQLQRYMKDPLVSKLTNLHKYIIVASLRGVLKVEEMKA
jgi:hypothetical protein